MFLVPECRQRLELGMDIFNIRLDQLTSVRRCLPLINSATKYPSILTYHKLGERGRLLDQRQYEFTETIHLTEKVDGTNSRVIVFPNGRFFIGSRDNLLYASGDLVLNPQLGIVETLLGEKFDAVFAEWERFASETHVVVMFMETYGHGIGKAGKNYAQGTKSTHVRLFDIVRIPIKTMYELLQKTPEQVASWRDHGGQVFDKFDTLADTGLPVVPEVGIVSPDQLPDTVVDGACFLNEHISESHCGIVTGLSGQIHLPSTVIDAPDAEGLVLRTTDRKVIAKMRFEDYARTLRDNSGERVARGQNRSYRPVN